MQNSMSCKDTKHLDFSRTDRAHGVQHSVEGTAMASRQNIHLPSPKSLRKWICFQEPNKKNRSIPVFGFQVQFQSNSTTAEKNEEEERWKKVKCLATFRSHMMGVMTDRAERKWLPFLQKVTKHSTRTKTQTNLSQNEYTYILTSHAACSSLFNSVGREE